MPKVNVYTLNEVTDSEKLYTQITQLNNFSEILELHCDTMNWVDASCILTFVLIARLWLRWTGYETLVIGLTPEIHEYFQRLGLFGLPGITLREAKELGYEAVSYFGQRNSRMIAPCFLPSHSKANRQVMDAVLDHIESVVTEWFGNDNRLRRDVLQILSELGENIQHSEDYAYLMLQRYKKSYTTDETRLVISIVDLGVGIRYSLERQALIETTMSDSDCIVRALEKGITGTGAKRGVGLDEVKYRTLRSAGSSELRIRSGRGAVLLRSNELIHQDNLANIPGVQICLSIEGRHNLQGWI